MFEPERPPRSPLCVMLRRASKSSNSLNGLGLDKLKQVLESCLNVTKKEKGLAYCWKLHGVCVSCLMFNGIIHKQSDISVTIPKMFFVYF